MEITRDELERLEFLSQDAKDSLNKAYYLVHKTRFGFGEDEGDVALRQKQSRLQDAMKYIWDAVSCISEMKEDLFEICRQDIEGMEGDEAWRS